MIAFALNQSREELVTVANFSEMGTQKTQATINSIDVLLHERKVKHPHNILVICPLSVIWSWKAELEEVKDHPDIHILYGTPQRRIQQLVLGRAADSNQRWFLINYEGVGTILKELVRLRWSAIVCDESIKIKRKRSKMTTNVAELTHRAYIRFILSGKPITLNPLDLFGHFWVLKPSVFGKYFTRFKRQYCDSMWTGQYEKILSWKNLDELIERIYPWTIRYLKTECIDLPPKLYSTRYCVLSSKERQAYQDLRMNSILELQNIIKKEGFVHIQHVITKFTKLNQLAQGFIIVDDTGVATNMDLVPSKIKLLEELLGTELIDGQIVIWCNFRQDILNVHKLLDRLKISNYTFYGDTSHEDRRKILDEFTVGNVRVIVAQPQAGGMGLNLTAARHQIFYSNSFDYGIRAQAEDRLHRPGQKHKVNIIDLVSKDTIEPQIQRSLHIKKNFSEIIDMSNPTSILS